MSKKPNVLFIISDQHNAKFMGVAGHKMVKTPNIDKLAGEGVFFKNAITQSPICTPSRTSFISGQYCHNHLHFGNNGPGFNGLPTIFGHFRRSGYTTAAIGKIHCPEYWVEDDTDFFLEVYDGASIGGAPEYTKYLKEKGLLEKRDDGTYPEITEPGQLNTDGRVSDLPYEDSVEGYTVQQTKDFISKSLSGDKPFFVHCSLPRPHSAYCPSEPFWSMYSDKDLELPPNTKYDMSLKAPHLLKERELYETGKWTVFEPRTYEAGMKRKMHGYLGCVSQVDHAAGELIDFLEQNKIEKDTIVIYTSDHGDHGCEHGLAEKAPGICSDSITRVPFIWRWPGKIKKDHISPEIVETVDLSATLCSLTGLDPMETSDGKDLSPLLKGSHEEIHKIGVTEFLWSKSVRKGKFRFVYYPPDMFLQEYPEGFGELYDLENDPWEMKNLYFEKDYTEKIREIKDDFLQWLITTTRPVTTAPNIKCSEYQSKTRNRVSVNPDGKIHPDRLRGASNINYL